MSAIGSGPGCNHNPSWLCPDCYPKGYGQQPSNGSATTDGGSKKAPCSEEPNSTNSSNSSNNSPTCTPSTKC